jgi:CubicO group peptidase (beta-lactamase class C family)
MYFVRCTFIFITIFCQGFSYADVSHLPEISQTKKEELRRSVIEIANKHKLVGLQISLNHESGKLLTIEHGLASIEDGKHIDQSSLFRVGSISKTIAAIAIMQLVESKQVSL